MSYTNSDHQKRLVVIHVARDLFADVSVINHPKGAIKTPLVCAEPPVDCFIVPEKYSTPLERNVYNMPFLFMNNGLPWFEANAYLMSLVQNKHVMSRPTDDVRRKASRLLDYKLYCEHEKLDWLDFSGKRPSLRPTYKYYRHLLESGERGAAVINQFTGIIYDFYKYVAKHCHHHIDIDRVDSVKTIKILLQGSTGAFAIDRLKRSQTRPTGGASPVPIGYIREDGEDLRPLTNRQLIEFMTVINGDDWSAQERLIMQCALFTGARKQSVLTLRMKHLQYFTKENLNNDGTYTVHAGPGTGIDTKFGKPQQLHFPKQLAEELIVYAQSALAKSRRKKLKESLAADHPDLTPMDDDIYTFLSDQGNCYYMAKDDPRYPTVKSRPIGLVTDTLKRKLFKYVSETFPKDFTYHWLRATYAYQFYQWLLPLVESGHLQIGEEISLVQRRLHHAKRETTENYLKLFNNVNEKLQAQELYENKLFDGLALNLDLEDILHA